MKNVWIDKHGTKWRTCKVCSVDKLFTTEFFARKNGSRDGGYWLRTECHDCVRVMAANKRAALKSADRPMPDNCECCGRPRGKKSLCCDHKHGTTLFRGWICQACNKGIGMTIDDPEIGIENVLRYYKNNDPEQYELIKQTFIKLEDK
jgi:hypothetical protein